MVENKNYELLYTVKSASDYLSCLKIYRKPVVQFVVVYYYLSLLPLKACSAGGKNR